MTEQLTQNQSQQSVNSLDVMSGPVFAQPHNPSLGTLFWKHALDQNAEMNFRLEDLTRVNVMGMHLGSHPGLLHLATICPY